MTSKYAGKLRSASLWQIASVSSVAIIQAISLYLIAWKLSPAELGSLALLQVFLGISQSLSDGGLSSFYIYKQQLTKKESSTLYWLNVVLGASVCLLLIALAGVIGAGYKNSELPLLIQVASFSILIIAIGAQRQAELLKTFAHGVLAKIDMISRVVSLVSLFVFLESGYEALSVPLSLLLMASVKTTSLLWVGGLNSLPSFEFDFRTFKEGFNFGRYQLGSQLLSQLRSNIDHLIVGAYLSSSDLGIYYLAKQLVTYPTRFIAPVFSRLTLPMFAAESESSDKRSSLFLKVIEVSTALNVFVFGMLAVYSSQIFELFFKAEFQKSAAVLSILAIAWLIRGVCGSLMGPILQGVGKPGIDFAWNFGAFWLTAIGVYLFGREGVMGVAYALLGIQLILLVFAYMVMVKPVFSISYIEFYRPMVRYCMLLAIVHAVIAFLSNDVNTPLTLVSIILVTMLIYGVASLVKINQR